MIMSSINETPTEVKEYFTSGQRTIKDVTGNDNFTLTILFDNGEQRIYDMKNTLQGRAFTPFRNIERFKEVYVDDMGCIAWDINPNVDSSKVWSNHVDLCPDSCYIYSKPLDG
jgi:hypothetical protein